MTVKSQFLKKLRARQPAPVSFTSKTQADNAEFRLRMTQLQEQIDVWLVDTGLKVETLSTSVTDLLVESGVFDISAIVLRHDDRIVKFMPLFLYGQGVTGCVEVTLHAAGGITFLGRLCMRSGNLGGWSFMSPDALSLPVQHFDESTFFNLILALLP